MTTSQISTSNNFRKGMKRPANEILKLAQPQQKLCRRTVILPIEIPLTDFRCFQCFQVASFALSCSCFLCRKCHTRCTLKQQISNSLSSCLCPNCGQDVKSMDQLDDTALNGSRDVIDRVVDWGSAVQSFLFKQTVQKANHIRYQDKVASGVMKRLGMAQRILQKTLQHTQAGSSIVPLSLRGSIRCVKLVAVFQRRQLQIMLFQTTHNGRRSAEPERSTLTNGLKQQIDGLVNGRAHQQQLLHRNSAQLIAITPHQILNSQNNGSVVNRRVYPPRLPMQEEYEAPSLIQKYSSPNLNNSARSKLSFPSLAEA